MDKGGISGEGRSWNFHIDSTAPTVGSISTLPSGYTSTTSPILLWSGVTEKHLKEIQYQVGNAPYVTAGTGESGNIVIPSSYFQASGTYPIRVRAVDHAGNVSAVKSLNYLLDITYPMFGTLASVPAAGTWTETEKPVIKFENITETHSGIDAAGVQYCITKAGETASEYKAASGVSFTSASNPYSGSFAADGTGLEDGEYTVHVRLRDKVGNAAINSLSYKKDRTAPEGELRYNQDKSKIHDNVQITVGCTDGTGSGVKTGSLLLQREDGTQIKLTENFTEPFVLPFDSTEWKNGEYDLVLSLEDYVGHKTEARDTIVIQNQLPAPAAEGSNRENGTAFISWKVTAAENGFQGIEYQLDGSSVWQKLNGTVTKKNKSYSGTGSVSLPDEEGMHRVKIRAVDGDGLPGKEGTVVCIIDKTAPDAVIHSVSQGAIRGTVADSCLEAWRIKVRDKAEEGYRELHSDTYAAANEILYIVDMGSEEYQAGHTYEFLLEAMDAAGNLSTAVYEYIKQEGDGMAVEKAPVWFLDYPTYLETGKNEYALPQNTNYLELKSKQGKAPVQVEWYIDNKIVDEGNGNPDKPWILDFYKLKGNYTAGTKHTVTVRCIDTDGKVSYSVPEYKNVIFEYLPTTKGTEKTLRFQEPLTGFTLDFLEKDTGRDAVSCYVRIGTSVWKHVEPGREYSVCELFDGQLSTDTLTVKATWGDVCPGLKYFHFSGNTIEPETFSLSEMNNYVPVFLSAVSKINYKTYLTWNRAAEQDTADMTKEHAVEIPENVSYEIYRATSEEELLAMTQPSVADVRDDYYSEINVNYGREFYYRIRAVKKITNQQTGETQEEYSNFSHIVSTRVVDGNEYTKLLGYKSYWAYESFENPNGTGYVEKSQGNFVYIQTDASIDNEKMPVTVDRTYNSQASTVSSLGMGWNHSYDIELLNINEGDKLADCKALRDATGTIITFSKLADGSYTSTMGKYMMLTQEEKRENVEIPSGNGNTSVSREIASSYTVLTKDNLEYRFNSGGQLIYAKEPNGSFLLFAYDEKTGRLVSVTTNQNLVTSFEYADNAKSQIVVRQIRCGLISQIKCGLILDFRNDPPHYLRAFRQII